MANLDTPYARFLTARRFDKVGQPALWTRHYKHLDSAVGRATSELIHKGIPGSVVEIAHDVSGAQIAVVKIGVGGRITITNHLDDWNTLLENLK